MRFLFLIILITMASCKIQTPEELKQQTTLNTVKNYKWKKFPITIYLPSAKRAETENAMINSIRKWNDALGFTAFNYQYTNYDHTKYERSNTNRVFILDTFNGYDGRGDNYNYIKNNDEIVASDILLDNRDHRFDDNEYDYEDVFTHQLGHVLGLHHNDYGADPDSVMNGIVMAIYNTFLSSGDVQRIKSYYGR